MSIKLLNRPYPFSKITINHGCGSILYDQNGNSYIDLTSGFGVAALGYSNKAVQTAVANQMAKLSHAIPSLIGFSDDYLAEDSILNALGCQCDCAIITTSGSEAVEIALKAAFLATKSPGVIIFEGAYHGQSLGTLTVNGQSYFSHPFKGLYQEHTHIARYNQPQATATKLTDDENNTLDNITDIIQRCADGPDAIGTIIVEPMQNLAGYRKFSELFSEEINKICKRNKIILICDEIFTGFGRCGEWSVSEKFGFLPDLRLFGKAMTGGIPGGVCVGSLNLLKHLYPLNSAPLHAPTFFNAPVVCAAINATIREIIDQDLLSASMSIENKVRSVLSPYIEKSSFVTCLRGAGAAQALVFPDHPERQIKGSTLALELCNYMLDHKVLAVNSGFPVGNVVTICPPLVINEGELDFALRQICCAIKAIEYRNKL